MPTILGDKLTVVAASLTTTWNDVPSNPSGAQAWRVDKLAGWDDTSDMDFNISERVAIDGDAKGDYDALRARHLLVGGYVLAATRAQAEVLWDTIVRAMPRNVEMVLTRHEPIPKFVRCYRGGKIERPEWLDSYAGPGQGFAMRWEAPFVCLDPLKYDVNLQSQSAGVAGHSTGGRTYPRTYPMTYSSTTGSGNAITLNNIGTAGTAPTLTLNGPLLRGNWHITNDTTFKEFRMDIGLALGDVLVLDFRRKVATLNGQVVFASITGDYFDVVRGQNVIRLYADFDAAAGITGSIYSAWE